jgi:hypothetical protein
MLLLVSQHREEAGFPPTLTTVGLFNYGSGPSARLYLYSRDQTIIKMTPGKMGRAVELTKWTNQKIRCNYIKPLLRPSPSHLTPECYFINPITLVLCFCAEK